MQQTSFILESISDAYLSVDQDWRCTYLNQAMEQLMHIRREDMLGRDMRAFFADTDVARYRPFYEQAMRQRTTTTFESFYPSRGIWAEVRVFPNENSGITIYHRDITAQRLTEDKLRRSEELFRLLNENLHDHGLVIVDVNGNIIDWNVGAERMFGFSADEVMGQNISLIFTPEDRAAHVSEQEIQTAATTGRAEDERWQQRKDGSVLWASGSTTALRDEQGQLRGFVKIMRDQTERRQMTAALERSEERLRAALKAATLGTWNVDLATQSMQWDAQHYQLFGLPHDDQAQPLAAFFQYIYPDDREQVQKIVAHALQDETSDTFRVEYRVIWPDGSVHWLASEGSVQHDETGQPTNLIGVSTDITGHKTTEAALRQYRDELEQRVDERTAELAQVNRDLQSEIIERQRAEDTRRDLLLQLMVLQENERHRIARELHDHMGQQLVALSLRLKALEDSFHTNEGTLASIKRLREMADELTHEMHRLALDLRPPALDELGLLRAMQTLVEQWGEQAQVAADFHSRNVDDSQIPSQVTTAMYRVVQEALTNVVKHAHAKHVSVIVEDGDNNLVVIVEDDGIGFDTDVIQARHTNQMGLQSMQERIAIIGGTLTIESSPGAGTTVFVRVSLAQ